MNYNIINKIENNLSFRLLIFVILVILSISIQLSALSKLINNVVGTAEQLKKRINYWITISNIWIIITNFLIGRWFTKDFVWLFLNKKSMNIIEFSRIWGLDVSLFTFFKLFKNNYIIKFISIILFLIYIISLILVLLLTYIAKIEDHQSLSSIYDVGIYQQSENTDKWINSGYELTNMYATSSMLGMVNNTMLHKVDDNYFWSPSLVNKSSNILIYDFPTFSIKPKCYKLDKENIIVTQKKTNLITDYEIKIKNLVDTMNSCIPIYNCPDNGWNMLATKNWYSLLYSLNANEFVYWNNIYHVFTVDEKTASDLNYTFKIGNESLYYGYIYNCTYELQGWNLTGIINSSSIDNLKIINKTKTKIYDKYQIYVSYSYIGLIKAMLTLTTHKSIPSPLEKWMLVNKDKNTWNGINESWLEYKMVEIIAYMNTPNIFSDEITYIKGQNIINDSIIYINKNMLILLVLIQVFLIITVIIIYLSKKYQVEEKIYRSDDILNLLNYIGFKKYDILNKDEKKILA